MTASHVVTLLRSLALSLVVTTSAASGVTTSWQRVLSTSTDDVATGVTTDGATSVYVVGRTNASLTGPHEGFIDAFLRKYDMAGNIAWSRQLGTNKNDMASAISIDDTGSVYVVGGTSGSLSGANAGSSDAFISKYNASGTPLWTRQFGTTHGDNALGVTFDGIGNIYVAGTTAGNLHGEFNAANGDAFIAKYSDAGTLLWTRLVGTPQIDLGMAVTSDEGGNVYIVGTTWGDLAGQTGSQEDAFIRKYDTAGNVVWTRQFGTTAPDRALAVTSDHFGNLFISGYTQGDLAGTVEGQDAFVTKLDQAGDVKWIRQFGSFNDDYANAVAATGDGGVYVAGSVWKQTGPETGNAEAFVKLFDANGNGGWSQLFGTPGGDYAYAVASNSFGSFFVAGELSPGDAFITKFNAVAGDYNGDGVADGADFLEWQRRFGNEVLPMTGADGDGSGIVDDGDLVVWKSSFAKPSSPIDGTSNVPEPSSSVGFGMALCWFLASRTASNCCLFRSSLA